MDKVAIISCVAMLSSCSPRVDSVAIYCVGNDSYFYITKDLKTYGGHGSKFELGGATEGGKIYRENFPTYVKYSGELNFIIFRSMKNTKQVPGFNIQFHNEYYIVKYKKTADIGVSYFVHNDGYLMRYEEKISLVDGGELTIPIENCGGKFGL